MSNFSVSIWAVHEDIQDDLYDNDQEKQQITTTISKLEQFSRNMYHITRKVFY